MNHRPNPARLEFGEVLRFHREARTLTTRRVADMCCVSREAVENWEAGHTVPDGKAWDKYKGIVNKRLVAYAELRSRALQEAETERTYLIRSMENRIDMATTNGSNGHHPAKPASPTLTHKPLADLKMPTAIAPDARTVNPGQAVTYHAAPPPQQPSKRQPPATAREQLGQASRGISKDGRTLIPTRPPGSMKRDAINERIAWARLQFRSRPKMPVNGADGLLAMMRGRFGVGLDPDTCEKIKGEVHAELSLLPPSAPPGIVSIPPRHAMSQHVPRVVEAPPQPPQATAVVKEGDLASAVELVLGAVPGLRSFSIVVDDYGEASVEYTVREVKVTERGGTMKVKR